MRIANLMLSCTMPPGSHPQTPTHQPYQCDAAGHKLNSVEREQEQSKDARRGLVMSLMKGGWASGSRTAAPASAGSGELLGGGDGSFVPRCVMRSAAFANRSFSRLDFLEKWRKSRTDENGRIRTGPDAPGLASSGGAASPAENSSADAKRGAQSKKKKPTKAREAEQPGKGRAQQSSPDAAANGGSPKAGKPSKPKRRKTDDTNGVPHSEGDKAPGSSPVAKATPVSGRTVGNNRARPGENGKPGASVGSPSPFNDVFVSPALGSMQAMNNSSSSTSPSSPFLGKVQQLQPNGSVQGAQPFGNYDFSQLQNKLPFGASQQGMRNDGLVLPQGGGAKPMPMAVQQALSLIHI